MFLGKHYSAQMWIAFANRFKTLVDKIEPKKVEKEKIIYWIDIMRCIMYVRGLARFLQERFL